MFKKLFIILAFTTGMIIFTGCGAEKTTEKKATEQNDKKQEINPAIPETPPGFDIPEIFGKLDIDDYTQQLKKTLPDEEVEYSAIWSFDTDYMKDWKFDKPWEQMSPEEQKEFNELVKKTSDTLVAGVKKAGGELKIKSDSDHPNGLVYGKWEVSHKSSELVKLWGVNFTSHYNKGLGNPLITIHIRHTKLK
jgi:hypothetical protein